jgi:hypothetical protein
MEAAMTAPTIKAAMAADEMAVSDVVTLAFSTDPVAHCGFELLGTIQAGGAPPLFPMLGKPR